MVDLNSDTPPLVPDTPDSIRTWLGIANLKRSSTATSSSSSKRPSRGSAGVITAAPSSNSSHKIKTFLGAATGDVIILLGNGYHYRADCSALKKASTWFNNKLAYLEGEFDINGLVYELPGIVACFWLPKEGKPVLTLSGVITPSSDVTVGTEPEIKQEVLEEAQSPPTSNRSADLAVKKLRQRDAYLILLCIMHGSAIPPNSENFNHALQVTELVIRLAKIYDCAHLLRPTLSFCLHAYRHELFYGVRDDPPRCLILAIALEDSSISKEALIHMVGCWPRWDWPTPQEALVKAPGCDKILDLITKKSVELHRECRDLDRKLFLNAFQYGDGEDAPPVTIKDNKITWLLVQFFRDWLGTSLHATQDPDTSETDPRLVGEMYRKIYKGGDAYLPIDEVQDKLDELKIAYYGKEVKGDLKKLKEFATIAVEDVCKNHLMLEVGILGVKHLTCVEIGEEDLPWVGSRADAWLKLE
ncbi:hypothetical protein EJ08DRAFT_738995 [Tothia fuscella]|uniref:BTB domain-containing protein n=1 Tax=Tothia fuscella TaxID=1048955 RepID=A0A9P4NFC8_9PEZI|nr:hypothetical protein EJ08DRAFT_738995 [Tothia fuscella]